VAARVGAAASTWLHGGTRSGSFKRGQDGPDRAGPGQMFFCGLVHVGTVSDRAPRRCTHSLLPQLEPSGPRVFGAVQVDSDRWAQRRLSVDRRTAGGVVPKSTEAERCCSVSRASGRVHDLQSTDGTPVGSHAFSIMIGAQRSYSGLAAGLDCRVLMPRRKRYPYPASLSSAGKSHAAMRLKRDVVRNSSFDEVRGIAEFGVGCSPAEGPWMVAHNANSVGVAFTQPRSSESFSIVKSEESRVDVGRRRRDVNRVTHRSHVFRERVGCVFCSLVCAYLGSKAS
jgi:hypothetical protein